MRNDNGRVEKDFELKCDQNIYRFPVRIITRKVLNELCTKKATTYSFTKKSKF